MSSSRLEELTTAHVDRWAANQLKELEGHPFVAYGGGTPAHVEFSVRFRLFGDGKEANAATLARRIRPTVTPTEPDEHGIRLIEIGRPRQPDEQGDPVVEVHLGVQAPDRL